MNFKEYLEERYTEEKAAELYEALQRNALYCAKEILSHSDIPSDPVLGRKIADAFLQYLPILAVKQEALREHDKWFGLEKKPNKGIFKGTREECKKKEAEDAKEWEQEKIELKLKRIRLLKESPEAIAVNTKYEEIRAQISLFTWQFIEGLTNPNYEFDPKDTKIPKDILDFKWENDLNINEKNIWLEDMGISSFDSHLKKTKLGVTKDDKRIDEMVGEEEEVTQSETRPDFNTITQVKRKMDKADLQPVREARSSGLIPKASYEVVRALAIHSIWRQYEHMDDLGMGQVPQRFKGIITEFLEEFSPSKTISH